MAFIFVQEHLSLKKSCNEVLIQIQSVFRNLIKNYLKNINLTLDDKNKKLQRWSL